MKYFLLILSILLGAFNQIILKIGANKETKELPKIDSIQKIFEVGLIFLKNYWIISALLLYALGFFVWVLTLTKFNLTYAFPLMSITYILVLFLSWLILKENISILKIIGTITITIGVILIVLDN